MQVTQNRFILLVVIATLVLGVVDQTSAQLFRTLHSFTANAAGTNVDGANPFGLILSGNSLYGAAPAGGSMSHGTLFTFRTDGTGFTNVYRFSGGSDGELPLGNLVLWGGTLYGTALRGGSSGAGTVFALNADGSRFTTLHSFTGASDGSYPAGLILLGSTLYGTAGSGGTLGFGTVYSLSTNGAGLTILHTFNGSDGAYPKFHLVASSNTLYGTTMGGGASGSGSIFRINIDGGGFATLYSFAPSSTISNANSDGASPQAELTLSENTLYGTARFGGTLGNGTVFRINTDGTAFTNLWSFPGDSDGAYPLGSLVVWGGSLYGTTLRGGTSGSGTVFTLNTNGSGFATLHSFTGGSDGAFPSGELISSSNALYGTTARGGISDAGTTFSISLPMTAQPMALTITRESAVVILTWPTNATGLTVQSSTKLGLSAIWSPISAVPAVINGQNTVTNSISEWRQFYRLSQ